MIDRDKLPYRQGVVAYVRNPDNKYLIFQHPDWKDNTWRIPGGGIKENEDYESAIKRELLEEFSIQNIMITATSSLVNQYEWPDELIQEHIDKNKPVYRGQQQKQVLIKLDKFPTVKVKSEEIKEYKWIDQKEFTKYFVFPGQAEKALLVIEEFKKNGY